MGLKALQYELQGPLLDPPGEGGYPPKLTPPPPSRGGYPPQNPKKGLYPGFSPVHIENPIVKPPKRHTPPFGGGPPHPPGTPPKVTPSHEVTLSQEVTPPLYPPSPPFGRLLSIPK